MDPLLNISMNFIPNLAEGFGTTFAEETTLKLIDAFINKVTKKGVEKIVETGTKEVAKIILEEGMTKSAEKLTEAITMNASKEASKIAIQNVAKSSVTVTAQTSSQVGSSILTSKIPVIGLCVRLPFILKDLYHGKYLLAGMGLTSSLASTIPGAGTAISYGIDAVTIGVSVHQAMVMAAQCAQQKVIELWLTLFQTKVKYDEQMLMFLIQPIEIPLQLPQPLLELINPYEPPLDDKKKPKKKKQRKNIFQMQQLIGQGCQGKVYFILDLEKQKQYCIKSFESKMYRNDYEREKQALAMYNHKNIVKLEGEIMCLNNSTKYLLLEKCDMNLEQIVQQWKEQRNFIKMDCLDRFIIDIAQGLSVIHSNRGVHRDLRPPNIFYKRENESKNSRFIIGDLGLLKEEAQSLYNDTIQSFQGGDNIFQAPEILEQISYSDKSDIYSFGQLIKYCFLKYLDQSVVKENYEKFNKLHDLVTLMTNEQRHQRPSMPTIIQKLSQLGIKAKVLKNGPHRNIQQYDLYYEDPYFYEEKEKQ